jgi:hypothetical protein
LRHNPAAIALGAAPGLRLISNWILRVNSEKIYHFLRRRSDQGSAAVACLANATSWG